MTALSPALGLRSPPTPRSDVPSPCLAYGVHQLWPYIMQLLISTLQNVTWVEAKDRDRGRALMKEIGDRVKGRMISVSAEGPRFRSKYIALMQINENLRQGGQADMMCHWEDTGTDIQEVFISDSLIRICVAFTARTG
ncbi:hypothetical protein K488DRAFT_57166 [Vararia minispora EC-137]|uniref:Uncharacterized protein n=1 Tax=Vararia minispora EC-137 TaxID=1314806 RepID=A0ACB8QBU9_9AGAM|nr:hypothetical protein K488DRAFT_57166 [Vararia minispora EC-137]